MMKKHYFALAYYLFKPIQDPRALVTLHKKFFEDREAKGRIYISEEGINGQMSATIEDAEAYMAWFKSFESFADTKFKLHQIEENVFPRMTVKYRKQLVALDEQLDPSQGGEHVSPEKWKKMLESGEYLVLDVRNQYEWEIGHFEGAVLPPLKTFREFPQYAEQLSHEVDPKKTKVMMYCTGGIRCELYSVLMKNKGFEQVFQLDGGVIDYGLKEGSEHWKGKLFVFDDRLAVPIDGKECAPIAHCAHCQLPCDIQYNCANMDCNELFVCCKACYPIYKGCCTHTCTQQPRVRPLELELGNKPFRRKHLIGCALPNPKPSSESDSSQQ